METLLILWLFASGLAELVTTYLAGVEQEGKKLVASLWGYWGFGFLVVAKAIKISYCAMAYKLLIMSQQTSGLASLRQSANLIMLVWCVTSSMVVVWNLYALLE